MNKHNDVLREEATNFLVFDPAQAYTGWLLYKPAHHKIVSYNCITQKQLLEGKIFTGSMEKRVIFMKEYAQRLTNLMKMYDPEFTWVIMEEPIGSRSAKAAWGMAMASQAVVATAVAMTRKQPYTYREHDAKKYMFQTGTVPKQKTMKTMWNYWLSQGITDPKKRWDKHTVTDAQRREYMSHVADAMLILNLHLHNLYENGLELSGPQ
jgi:hypothetical protein